MSTACWGTNASFDCAWVYFGYGSRYDMINDYHKGWWLSLDALKVLVKYDYPIHQVFNLNTRIYNWDNDDEIGNTIRSIQMCDKYKNDHGYFSEDIWNSLPFNFQMASSAVHINHPKSDDWFWEVKKHAGLFKRENPNYRETIYYNCGRDLYEDSLPSLKAIKTINYSDWEIISRVEYMNLQAMESERERENYTHRFESVDDMFKELDNAL